MQRIKRERAQRARELDMRKNQGMRIDIKDIDARKALKNLKPAIGTTVAQTSAQFDGRIAAATDRLAHLQTLRRRHLDERHAELTQGIDAHPQRPRHRGPTRYAEHRPARPHRHQRSKWQR